MMMRLMKCGDCGKDVSTSAEKCPHCGRPHHRSCPSCGHHVLPTDPACTACGRLFHHAPAAVHPGVPAIDPNKACPQCKDVLFEEVRDREAMLKRSGLIVGVAFVLGIVIAGATGSGAAGAYLWLGGMGLGLVLPLVKPMDVLECPRCGMHRKIR